jgi:hypothetical protein
MWGFQVNTTSPRCQWDLDRLIDRLDFAHKIFRSLELNHVMSYSQTEITVSTCVMRAWERSSQRSLQAVLTPPSTRPQTRCPAPDLTEGRTQQGHRIHVFGG